MGRRFSIKHNERHLQICVQAIDEAWNLWVCELGCRLALGATITIDAAMEARRSGKDAILAATEQIGSQIKADEMSLPIIDDRAHDRCPTH